MALSAAQLAARAGKLTSSRVACLMTGDAEKILRLYREMIGEATEDDLSGVWAVRLGETTEALNLEWFERKNSPVSRRGEVVVHALYPWAACTLDGWCDTLQCPIEAKHVGGREPLEVVIERYQPQMQWAMEVTCAEQCGLSVIMGANDPVVEFIERDASYAQELVARGSQFMNCVRMRTPPVALPPAPVPIVADKTYDMQGNNVWGSAADAWLQHRDAAEACKNAEKVLKAAVPADAKKAVGYGVQVTRDRVGRLSLRAAA